MPLNIFIVFVPPVYDTTRLFDPPATSMKVGVAIDGLVEKTSGPLPVSSVTVAARLALFGVARNVATPAPNPVMLPTAGVIVAFDAAVINPLPLTVNCPVWVAEPNDPTLAFTVASVAATLPVPEAVMSPVNAVIPPPPVPQGAPTET